jgi:hypothetical protein
VRFAVESWSPEYGSPTGDEALEESIADVDAWVEVAADDWGPRRAPASTLPLETVLFIDGVRRVEANVWITDDNGEVHQGLCASYAAGAVRCDGVAALVAAEVRRGLFCPAEGAEPIETRHARFALQPSAHDTPDSLSLTLQTRMGELEGRVAAQAALAAGAELIILDGPLKFGQHEPGKAGYIKTHHKAYGPPLVRAVVTRLGVGQRTPLMLVGDPRFRRYTWYLRLPCEIAHGWAGVVRLETSAEMPRAEVIALADRLCVTLPRFASTPAKDSRAPQNLYPIGGLERDLRRRLGDAALILRSLREAAARPPAPARQEQR